MKPTTRWIAFLFLTSTLAAQNPAVLLRDIRPGNQGSGILNFWEYEGRLFCNARQGASPTYFDLWSTDGSPAGTFPVTTPAMAVDCIYSSLVPVGGWAGFIGRTNAHGLELWRTDGTSAGTRRVTDLNPGSTNSVQFLFTAWRGYLWFAANVPLPADVLYRSDGTAAGTVPIANLKIVSNSMFVALGKLFFISGDNNTGFELFVMDDPAGTPRMLADIRPGPMSSNMQEFVEWRGKVWFHADDGMLGQELWTTDGTPQGTQLFADISPAGSSKPVTFVPTRNYLFFMLADSGLRIWQTDGTVPGTKAVPSASPLIGFPNKVVFLSVGDDVYARAATVAATTEVDLWRFDGTPTGTRRVRGSDPTRPLSPQHMKAMGSRYVYFAGDDGVSGYELWRSDGTTQGTVRVADIVPGAGGSAPSLAQPLGAYMVFAASTPATGVEPFAMRLDAHAHAFGRSCGAPARATTLAATDPVLGQTCNLSGTQALAGSAGALFLGLPAAASFPVLSDVCRWYLAPPMFFLGALGVTTSIWSSTLPIPNDASLIGALVRVQGVFVPTDAPNGFDVTNPVNLHLGL